MIRLLILFICRVRNWALKFGVDLWEFGRQTTKMNEIKNVRISSLILVYNMVSFLLSLSFSLSICDIVILFIFLGILLLL